MKGASQKKRGEWGKGVCGGRGRTETMWRKGAEGKKRVCWVWTNSIEMVHKKSIHQESGRREDRKPRTARIVTNLFFQHLGGKEKTKGGQKINQRN